jgi:hypothetical protein
MKDKASRCGREPAKSEPKSVLTVNSIEEMEAEHEG